MAVFALTQLGFVVSMGTAASAMVVLSGSTNCSLSYGFVKFLPGLAAVAPNGNERAEVYGQVTCNTPNVLPVITSLTGVFKGIIKFKHFPAPNKARECVNFNGASPVDQIIAVSKYKIAWTTNLGPAISQVDYTGTYSAVGSPTTMNLNFSTSAAVVTGSFAGTTAQLDYILPIPTPQCPVASGIIVANSGTLVM